MSTLSLVPVRGLIGITGLSSYDVVYDDTITVTGSGVTAGATVEVYWDLVQPWDGEAGLINTTKAKASGSWDCEIDVPDATGEDAHYIWARDASTGDTASDGPIVMNPSIEFDPGSGLEGDDVELIGHGFAAEVDVVTILYWDGVSNQTLDTSPSTPETNELGRWTADFEIPDFPGSSPANYGDYNVTTYDDDGFWATELLTVGASITLDIDEGPVGTLVQIKGRGFTAGTDIVTGMVSMGPKFPYVETEDDVSSGSPYSFTIEIVIPSLPDGEYDITVDDGSVSATDEFEIDEDGDADVDVDPTFGVQGSTIAISGANFSMVDDAEVIVELWDENNNTFVVDLDEYETDDDGEWDGTFTVPARSNGKYTIRAYQDDYSIRAEADFKIGSVIVILSKTEGPTGLEVVLTGTGFEYNTDWNATMNDELLVEGATDGSGNLEEGGDVPIFFVPTMPVGVYEVEVMDDEGTTVTVDFEVTDTTMVETDPLVAPAGEDSSGKGYNVTIIGRWFAQEEGATLDFVLYNDTDEWDLNVDSGGSTADISNEDDEGEFEAWWEVLTDLSIGSYTLNVTDEYDLFAQYMLELVPKTVSIDPRKSTFRIGDTVAFIIEHSFGTPGSYIKIWDPTGNLYWQTDDFEDEMWIKVGSIVRLPYFAQVAGGNPMTLLDDAPLGTWEWTWYDGEDELDSGSFEVIEAEADVLGQQVSDLANQITGLQDSVADVTAEFDDVRSDIADVAAIAEQAVAAANQATEAVQTVAQTANQANTAAEQAATAAEAARDAANSLTTLVYGAIGAALVAALAAIVSLMQISRRIAG
jgi:hypothetical protein